VTPIIEKLLLVQHHDCELMRLERELSDIPAHRQAIEGRLEEHRAALARAKEELRSKQAAIKEAELEVETCRGKIRKLREQQMQLKSNKDFRAMEEEIAGVDRNIRTLEDGMLELMELVEAAQARIRQLDAELKEEEARVHQEVAALEQRAQDLRTRAEAARQERARAAAEIEPERLRQYERILEHHRDRALVPVENGACGGCHMKLPPYQCHEARKQATVVLCEFCHRMLYWPEPLAGPATSRS